MSNIDNLIVQAMNEPENESLIDYLYVELDMWEEYELAKAIKGPNGKELLKYLANASAVLALPPSLKLLWFAHVVLPRLPQKNIVVINKK